MEPKRLIINSIKGGSEEVYRNVKAIRSAKYQPLVQKYLEVLDKANMNYHKDSIQQAFNKLSSDFERVCFILKGLEAFNGGKHGIEILGLPPIKEGLISGNLKSDVMANHFLDSSSEVIVGMDDWELAFNCLNTAYFYAESDEVKKDVLINRSKLHFEKNCFQESLRDAKSVLQFEVSPKEKMSIYTFIARCYVKEVCPVEAAEYFRKALQCVDSNMDSPTQSSIRRLEEEYSNVQRDCIERHFSKRAPWNCSYPLAPKTLNGSKVEDDVPLRNKKKRNKTRKAVNLNTQVKLLSVKDEILKLRNSNSERGWTLEASRDISVGDLLVVEKPYASVQLAPRTEFCYYCYRRCLNIQPCSGCAQVGFCSKKCAEDAQNPEHSIGGGPGHHLFDCGGLLPCLQLDDLFMNSEELFETTSHSHLAYTCIANTLPKTLLDYLCSTGRYRVRNCSGLVYLECHCHSYKIITFESYYW
ncbi:unnamed protein product [Rodentolepis nana]|uniref:SET and MYND domain-containing protein 4 n=1 Tax=Rodentolepis nana TaxID=102285 RepID=A0A0R3TG75_RODNA|nr:unnamed protein product [Rodentolepis nana]